MVLHHILILFVRLRFFGGGERVSVIRSSKFLGSGKGDAASARTTEPDSLYSVLMTELIPMGPSDDAPHAIPNLKKLVLANLHGHFSPEH